MSKYNDNFPEIFAKLKDGDCLGFYRGGIAKYIIPKATGGLCTHVGAVLNVKRTDDIVSFNFFEQSFRGATFDEVKIRKNSDGYTTDNIHFVKQVAIYYRELERELTDKEKELGNQDALSQKGRIYRYDELLLGFEFLEKILPRFIKNLLYRGSKNLRQVCSNNLFVFYRKLGFSVPKDFFATPYEVLNFSFFKKPSNPSNICPKV